MERVKKKKTSRRRERQSVYGMKGSVGEETERVRKSKNEGGNN